MKPRTIRAGRVRETHTFVDEVTHRVDFEVVRGEAIFSKRSNTAPQDCLVDETDQLDSDMIPTFDLRAMLSGTVEDEVAERFWTESAAVEVRAMLCYSAARCVGAYS